MAEIREYKLSNTEYSDIDLSELAGVITSIIEETVPGKHPHVYKDRFTTDQLTQGEAVRIGRALSRSPHLIPYGKRIETFRLFSGKAIKDNAAHEYKGGRKR